MLHGIRKKHPPKCVQKQLDDGGFATYARMMMCPCGERYINVQDLELIIDHEAILMNNPKCRTCLYKLLDKIKKI